MKKKCSSDREKLLKFEVKSQTIHEEWKVGIIFETECFVNLFLDFSRSNSKRIQTGKKKISDTDSVLQKPTGKVRKENGWPKQ